MIIIRQADYSDAAALFELNYLFNGEGVASQQQIEQSLQQNTREIIYIAYSDQIPIGFICAQIIDSFCYRDTTAQITELFVKEEFRRCQVATKLIHIMQKHLYQIPCCEIQLFTGADNDIAQAFYKSMGYQKNHEVGYQKDMLP